MYSIYQLLIALLFYLSLPILLPLVLITGKHRAGVWQRLGLYKQLQPVNNSCRIWIHAASVGEVQAASVLITELRNVLPSVEFVLTTMTLHGRQVAEELFPKDVTCLLAPLDVPGIVGWVIRAVNADLYICIETELWPILLHRLNKNGTPVVLANGRMSAKSAGRYLKRKWFFKHVVANFSRCCMISEKDRARYQELGVPVERMEIAGNLKYDRQLPDNHQQLCYTLRQKLQITSTEEVLITGSTHPGEEEPLISVYKELSSTKKMVWIIAPRHLKRLHEVEELLKKSGIAYHLYSEFSPQTRRQHSVILIDQFGKLSQLYCLGSYIFCGGSLIPYGGHNIMEPALWEKVVFYGPSMTDFQDAVEVLEEGGGGFCVTDGADLTTKIEYFRDNPAAYQKGCMAAGWVARAQQGAASNHAAMILKRLNRKQVSH